MVSSRFWSTDFWATPPFELISQNALRATLRSYPESDPLHERIREDKAK